MSDDAKRTVRPESSDHILLSLARLETLHEVMDRNVAGMTKSVENRLVQVHGGLNDLHRSQGKIMAELAKIGSATTNNANQILQLTSEMKQYGLHLQGVEKELDLVHATQKACPARAMWHEFSEDSKIIRVLQHRLDEKRHKSTPPEGFRLTVGAKNLNGLQKTIIAAVIGLALGAAATITAWVELGPQTSQPPKADKGLADARQ